MAVCCQNLTLGALSSRSALSVLVGAQFKKFGLFLNTPRILVQQDQQDALLIFSLFQLKAYTGFQHIYAHHQEVLYVQQLVYLYAYYVGWFKPGPLRTC
jgi:hypothetical protein